MESDLTGPVNLGNPSERTILEFAELIIQITNSKSKIIYTQLPKDDPAKRQPDISIAKKYLNWEPKIDIYKGLDNTIEYFTHLLKDEM